ncbi:MAG: DNA-3-methyladenine glycosylase 2 family protein [Clostridiales bacterium]|nr:DNA-3-methyladenine glycosylase 2 family protein [Clostridiales bacterium]
MEYTYNHGVITVSHLQNYNIDQIFDCGQCFRFAKREDGGWTGIAYRRQLTLRQPDSSTLQISGIDETAFMDTFVRFLCLEDDYTAIRHNIRDHFGQDTIMETAMAYGEGIRLLKQEPWEALCSFIISQNNNIPRIKKLIETLCRQCGEPIGPGLFAFPTPGELLAAGETMLRALGAGYRTAYLLRTAESVLNGSLDLAAVRALSTKEAIEALTKLHGVGPKVAACALLFGFDKLDCFPIDVWIKKVLHEYYHDALDLTRLGPYAGIAQQYLFYYITKSQKQLPASKERAAM